MRCFPCWYFGKLLYLLPPAPAVLLLRSESMFLSFPEEWHFYRYTLYSLFLVLKIFISLDWKKPTKILFKHHEENMFPSFSNFQDLFNEIEILMKWSWIHQMFIRMVLFIGISALAYWSVKIHVTIHLPSGSTSEQTSTEPLVPLKSAFSLELAFI